jgi:hypothetical protein
MTSRTALTESGGDDLIAPDADDVVLSSSEEGGRLGAIKHFLFPAPAERTTPAILRWWESRRLAYNAIVGSAGLVTVSVAGLEWVFRLLTGAPNLGFMPWQAVVAFGLSANILYCLGPATELLVNKLFGRTILPVGPSLFRMGLTFSVGLALFPGLILSVILVISTILRIFGVVVGPF